MTEETDIVLEEVAYVVDTETQHGDALDTHAESEATIFVGVDVVVLKDIGVDHATAEDFEPARAFADAATCSATEGATNVHFGTGLGEWEIGWSESDFDFGTKHFFGEIG